MTRSASKKDGRRRLVSLTDAGKQAFAMLDQRSRSEVCGMLERLPDASRKQLLSAMDQITAELSGSGKPTVPSYTLRPHRPGDMGWVTHRHGVL